jgi:hypothetical protein
MLKIFRQELINNYQSFLNFSFSWHRIDLINISGVFPSISRLVKLAPSITAKTDKPKLRTAAGIYILIADELLRKWFPDMMVQTFRINLLHATKHITLYSLLLLLINCVWVPKNCLSFTVSLFIVKA